MDSVESNLKEVKELITELRICVARMHEQQLALAEAMKDSKHERQDIHVKVNNVNEHVRKLEQRLTYAAGAIAAFSALASYFVGMILKKLGVG